MRSILGAVIAVALGLAASADPAVAQDAAVYRDGFVFLRNDLTIEVVADAPGELRVSRGAAGVVRVTGRAPEGLVNASLAGRQANRLELNALGADRADFLVTVPEDARVSVRLPDRIGLQSVGTRQRVASYRWEAAPRGADRTGALGRPGALGRHGAAGPPPARRSPAGVGAHVAYTASRAPRVVDVPALHAVRTLTVRWEGRGFRVETGRPMKLTPGDADRLEIRSDGSPQDITLVVSRQVPEFTLRLGGAVALRLRRGDSAAYCSPVMTQYLDAGRRWFTFTPHEGRLQCEASAGAVHTSR